MKECLRYEIGARVLLQNLDGDEADLNGLAGVVVELLQLDVGPPECAGVPDCGHDAAEHERMGQVRGWLHKVRLDDLEHSAQANGFMDSRVFWPFQVLELPAQEAGA